MKKVLVTGADEFLGKNLCAMLDRDEHIEVVRFMGENSPEELKAHVAAADFIFNLASVNGTEHRTGDSDLTEIIISHLAKLSRKTPIVLSSPTKTAENTLLAWAKDSGNSVYLYRLPEVFGKWSKPHDNSAVATLCYDVTHGQELVVEDPNSPLTLVYIDDVVDEFLRTLNGETKETADHSCQVRPEFTVTLNEIANKLREMQEGREKLFVPNFENAFDRDLYATFTSYFTLEQVGYPLDQKSDDRGWLVEFIKSQQFGQIYVSRTNPGFTRAIHWHNTKVEKFLVIGGEAEIKLRQLQSDKIETYQVNGEDLRVLEMPTGYVHSIKNTGKTDMYLLIWSQQVFDPERPDTYFQEL